MISCIDAHLRILETLPIGGLENVSIAEAAGRVLREPILADRDSPPFDRVMMDGFAVRAGGTAYQICGRVYAGESSPPLSDPSSAIEVMTGCVLPDGADAVVPIEDVYVDGDTLYINEPIQPGQFIHRQGNEGVAGRTVLHPGTCLGPAQLAIAATEGVSTLVVNARPRVHLITTGDEIVPVKSNPKPWQIRGSHAIALQAMLCRNPDVDFQHTHLADNESVLRKALDISIVSSDFLLICGGMSKGKRDLIPGLLQVLGAEPHFHFVAQRPGKPMGFWTKDKVAIFGLPGNPLAVLCTARRHVLPALYHWRGMPPADPPLVRLCGKIQPQTRFTTFHPVRLTAEGALPLSVANSGALHALAESDGFVEIPPGDKEWKGESTPRFWPWF
jgi:molybdopterin molybdotransferase